MSAARTEVTARIEGRTLRLDVRDEGRGRRADGSGLLGLGDRLAVLDGRLEVQSAPGGDTRIAATIPLP
jgi:signal transduction histidine kinase